MRPSRLYKLAHFLDLDIVACALGLSIFAARLFGSSPGWAWWPALAFTVWILYMGDHLVDAFRHRKKSRREMHRFVYENRRDLIWSMIAIVAADVVLILNFFKRDVLIASVVLAGLVLLFYTIRHVFRKNSILFIPGEFFVLLFFLGGTWLGPFIARSEPLLPVHGLVLAIMAGVLLMNLGIIALYDIEKDSRLGVKSMAYTLGKQSTKNLVTFTGILLYLMCALQFLVYGTDRYSQFVLIQAGMTTLLFLVLYLPGYFGRDDRYRISADAVLLLGYLALLTGS